MLWLYRSSFPQLFRHRCPQLSLFVRLSADTLRMMTTVSLKCLPRWLTPDGLPPKFAESTTYDYKQFHSKVMYEHEQSNSKVTQTNPTMAAQVP